ncbi:hypothetical protein Ciccas_012887, partial [Cichlidogyrus casuarinus]
PLASFHSLILSVLSIGILCYASHVHIALKRLDKLHVLAQLFLAFALLQFGVNAVAMVNTFHEALQSQPIAFLSIMESLFSGTLYSITMFFIINYAFGYNIIHNHIPTRPLLWIPRAFLLMMFITYTIMRLLQYQPIHRIANSMNYLDTFSGFVILVVHCVLTLIVVAIGIYTIRFSGRAALKNVPNLNKNYLVYFILISCWLLIKPISFIVITSKERNGIHEKVRGKQIITIERKRQVYSAVIPMELQDMIARCFDDYASMYLSIVFGVLLRVSKVYDYFPLIKGNVGKFQLLELCCPCKKDTNLSTNAAVGIVTEMPPAPKAEATVSSKKATGEISLNWKPGEIPNPVKKSTVSIPTKASNSPRR